MTEKRYTLRLHPKDNGVKIFNNHDEDNWRILNLHFNDYEDAKFVREKLEPVVELLNELVDEYEQLKQSNLHLQNQLEDYATVESENMEFREENEQLKQCNEKLQEYKNLVKIATSLIEWNTVPQIRRAWQNYLSKVGDVDD